MRLVSFLLLVLAALAVSGNAKTISDDSVTKNKFLSTSPDTGEGQEERAIGTADAASKLKRQLSSPNYNSVWNKLLRGFWRKMTPKDYRLPEPPKIPARMRPRPFDA
ncbi:hypothetical protein DVH05_024741 [Phytophthora capsici]|nr:hypothetical protein DVH05_024741 [Phytophthora capsici]